MWFIDATFFYLVLEAQEINTFNFSFSDQMCDFYIDQNQFELLGDVILKLVNQGDYWDYYGVMGSIGGVWL